MTAALTTPRSRRAAAMFGVHGARSGPTPLEHAATAARHIHDLLIDRPGRGGKDGRLILLTGPSGSGKSSALRELANLARARSSIHALDARELASLAARARPIVDCFRAPLPEALRTLAAFGLADATLFSLTPGELSDGQRLRLALAILAERIERARSRTPALLVIDEFAAILDRATAQCVARGLRRWVNRLSASACAASAAPVVIVATSHADLAESLRPDIVGEFDLGAPARIRVLDDTSDEPADDHVTIREGTIDDYRALARFHYRAGEPACVARVLRADDPDDPDDPPNPHNPSRPAGVLVVSMPTLNGRWRELAWPGRYRAPDRRTAATRLNAELRCISRVIVDPRRRASGVATALVREYLRSPLTPATEAVAAMGVCCPFFRRAGMTEYTLAPSQRDARLADAIAAADLNGRSHDDPPVSRLLLGTSRRARFITRELRHWARASRATRSLADAPIEHVAQAAWRALAAPLVAYAHVDPPPQRGGGNVRSASSRAKEGEGVVHS